MMCRPLLVAIASLAALAPAQARPHPHQPGKKEDPLNHIAQGGHVAVHAESKGKDPVELKREAEAAEAAREKQEHEAAWEKKQRGLGEKDVRAAADKQFHDKKKILQDVKELRGALSSTTTTTTESEVTVSRELMVSTTVSTSTTTTTTTQNAAEHEAAVEAKREQEQKAKEAKELAKKKKASLKAEEKVEKSTESVEHSLKQEADEGQRQRGQRDLDSEVQSDEAAAKSVLKMRLKTPDAPLAVPEGVVDPAVLSSQGEPQRAAVPKIVEQTEEKAHELATKEEPKSKSGDKSLDQAEAELKELKNVIDLKSTRLNYQAEEVKTDESRVAADVRAVKAMEKKVAQPIVPAVSAPGSIDSPKPIFKPLFKPHKERVFNPNSPAEQAKRSVAADEAREEAFQSKQHEMMEHMEAVKRANHHA